jgi:hypothetical protein
MLYSYTRASSPGSWRQIPGERTFLLILAIIIWRQIPGARGLSRILAPESWRERRGMSMMIMSVEYY